ncbi:MAG TPA: hypothetical protein VLV83_20175 [Acidobacteriota bacterium]|nr:hypothetical protein [Acidobacteriota bacterium]
MAPTAASEFVKQLTQNDQDAWNAAVEEVASRSHPVDQPALRIWFRFWPLSLCQALEKSSDPEATAKKLELDGNWRLEEQIDSSILFFYAARYWPAVKEAVLQRAQSASASDASLAEHALEAAQQGAQSGRTDAALLSAISLACLMMLRQVGYDALDDKRGTPADGPVEQRTPEQVLKARRASSGGLFAFLKGAARSYRVTWDERRAQQAQFEILQGQDISWAAARDQRDYRSIDPRRVEGPIPAQCRSAACGYCWVGVLQGEDNLSEASAFEQRRMRYFGYLPRDGREHKQPFIRLSCQAKCRGDVTVVVPPWNGVLDGER